MARRYTKKRSYVILPRNVLSPTHGIATTNDAELFLPTNSVLSYLRYTAVIGFVPPTLEPPVRHQLPYESHISIPRYSYASRPDSASYRVKGKNVTIPIVHFQFRLHQIIGGKSKIGLSEKPCRFRSPSIASRTANFHDTPELRSQRKASNGHRKPCRSTSHSNNANQ